MLGTQGRWSLECHFIQLFEERECCRQLSHLNARVVLLDVTELFKEAEGY